MNNNTKLMHEEKILQEAMSNGISSRKELANLLAQVAHESDNFSTMEENLNGPKDMQMETIIQMKKL